MSRAAREGYHLLRRASVGLRRVSHHFEGCAWTGDDRMQIRRSADGWELRVYEIGDEIEACVVNPAGESTTYA